MDDAKDQDQPLKLVIMGMENAGKTTIVDLLLQETDKTLNKPPNMIPTKGIVRRTLSYQRMIQQFQGLLVFTDMDESRFAQVLHLGDHQGDERKVEPSGRLVKVEYKGLFAVLEVKEDLVGGQVQLDFLECSPRSIFSGPYIHLFGLSHLSGSN